MNIILQYKYYNETYTLSRTGSGQENRICEDNECCAFSDSFDSTLIFLEAVPDHPLRWFTSYIKEIANSNLTGLYDVPELGWTNCSASEITVLFFLNMYRLVADKEYNIWFNLLPDKGDNVKKQAEPKVLIKNHIRYPRW